MSEIDIKVVDLPRELFGNGFRDHVEPVLYRTAELPSVAKIAIDLSRQLGIATCMADGEDSAGRQKFRLMEPDEVAKRAIAIAQGLWMQFERLGWIIAIPEPRLRAKEETEKA